MTSIKRTHERVKVVRVLRRARLGVSVVLLFLCLGCDPAGPGAMGLLTLSRNASVDAGRTLEIRAFPDDGAPFDPSAEKLADREESPVWRVASWSLADVEFPFEYMVGGGLGYTDKERWRVVAWIAGSDSLAGLRSGEWYGTRLFDVPECGGLYKYCGTAIDIDLEINTREE